jgi:hypothetical protein
MRVLLWLPALLLVPAIAGTGCGGNVFTSTSLAGAGGAAAGSGAASGRAGSATAGDTSDGGDANGGSAGDVSAGGTSSGGTIAVSGGSSVGGTAGHAGSVVGVGGSTAVADTACPTDPPGTEACLPGLSCTYGDDLRAQCRSRFRCVEAVWSSTVAKCADLISCDQVPEGFPKQGDACTTVGEDCTLDNGTFGKVYCRCDACTGASCTKNWECEGPPTGCPIVVPNDGQPCDTNGVSCLYGNCSMANGLQVDCTNKIWRWSVVACPAASN